MLNWRNMSWSHDQSNAIAVNVVNAEALVTDLEGKLLNHEGFAVATLNLDHLVKLRSDQNFATAYASMSHITADGNPVVWLLKLAGLRVELVPGSELVKPIAALAEKCNAKVGLLGSTEDSLAKTAKALNTEFPNLEIVTQISPPMGFDPESDIADTLIGKLAAAGARVVFLALGAPIQERFAARILEQQPQMGTFSIGAGLDFISGSQHRAPVWVRKIAMEWLWRLLHSPKRLWARYRNCFAILPSLTFSALRLRREARERNLERSG